LKPRIKYLAIERLSKFDGYIVSMQAYIKYRFPKFLLGCFL